ncbi:LamG-like jellyroll fold domain-containing protein, partial [Nitrosopumilus sp. S6]
GTSTDVIATNGTSTEPEIVIPNATMSFKFDQNIIDTNATSTEPITVANTTSAEQTITSLELDGQDDFIQIKNATVTDDVDGLTVTVWVKPDYSSGSSEFTVLSKDKSFSLTISNNFLSDNTAKFSVFDGIKWTTVESTSVITENWNFLSSTFDGDNIGIFVNGTREATQEVVGVPTLTTNGKLETTTVENLTSKEDIVIGATITTKNETPKASNQFSGEIDDVSLYDYVLEDEQILAMYMQTKDAYAEIVPELTLEEIIAQMEAEQLTNSENTTSTEPIIESNSTSTEIISVEPISESIPEPTSILEPKIISAPILDSTEETFELSKDATFELEFFDEYDALFSEIEEIESAAQILLTETESSLAELDDPEISAQSFSAVLGMIFSIDLFLPSVDAANGNDIEQTKGELESLKQQLESLKTQAASLKQSGNLDEESVKDLKKQLKSILNQIKSTSNKLNANDKAQAAKLDKSSEDAKKIADVDTFDKKQNGKWQDDETEINTEVFDSKGNKVDIKSEIQKNRDGKFTITLLPDSITTPGIYKLKTVFTVNGETHTAEEEFAWGLVSLNTAKSTYYPGDDAEFIIVVLDSEGRPVGGADIFMTVTSPDGTVTELETGDEISNGEEVGLYDATYSTGIEGTYQIAVNAQADGINTDFNTTFDVAEFVEYDIVRTAQSKIDPINNPNFFDVVIDIESFTGKDTITIVETVPAVFEISDTDANVVTVGDRKVLTWTTDLVNDRATIDYTYSVPLVFPQLYPLGPLEISDGEIMYTEARAWYVANDPLSIGVIGQTAFSQSATSPLALTGPTISASDLNPVLVVVVQTVPSTVAPTVTVGGVSMISAVSETKTGGGNDQRSDIFYLTRSQNLPNGASSISVTVGGTPTDIGAAAIALSGVQQGTGALGNSAVSGATDSGSITVTTVANDMVIDSINDKKAGGVGAVGAGQTVITGYATSLTNSGDGVGASRELATGTSTVMSWTLSGGGHGTAHVAQAFKPATTAVQLLSDSIAVSDDPVSTETPQP